MPKQPFASTNDQELIAGPLINELITKGAQVRIGENVAQEFTLTFWYFGPVDGSPTVAEVSFKCDTIDGEMPGKAAQRVFDCSLRFKPISMAM